MPENYTAHSYLGINHGSYGILTKKERTSGLAFVKSFIVLKLPVQVSNGDGHA